MALWRETADHSLQQGFSENLSCKLRAIDAGIQDGLSIDQDIFDAFRISNRIGEGSFINDRAGIEDDDVGGIARLQQPSALESERLGGF